MTTAHTPCPGCTNFAADDEHTFRVIDTQLSARADMLGIYFAMFTIALAVLVIGFAVLRGIAS